MEKNNITVAWIMMILATVATMISIVWPLPQTEIVELSVHSNLFLLITVGLRVVYLALIGCIFYWALSFAKENTLLLHQKNKEEEALKERQALKKITSAEDPYETKLKAFIQDGIGLAKRLRDEIPLETSNEGDRKKIQEKLDKTLLQWMEESEKNIKP